MQVAVQVTNLGVAETQPTVATQGTYAAFSAHLQTAAGAQPPVPSCSAGLALVDKIIKGAQPASSRNWSGGTRAKGEKNRPGETAVEDRQQVGTTDLTTPTILPAPVVPPPVPTAQMQTLLSGLTVGGQPNFESSISTDSTSGLSPSDDDASIGPTVVQKNVPGQIDLGAQGVVNATLPAAYGPQVSETTPVTSDAFFSRELPSMAGVSPAAQEASGPSQAPSADSQIDKKLQRPPSGRKAHVSSVSTLPKSEILSNPAELEVGEQSSSLNRGSQGTTGPHSARALQFAENITAVSSQAKLYDPSRVLINGSPETQADKVEGNSNTNTDTPVNSEPGATPLVKRGATTTGLDTLGVVQPLNGEGPTQELDKLLSSKIQSSFQDRSVLDSRTMGKEGATKYTGAELGAKDQIALGRPEVNAARLTQTSSSSEMRVDMHSEDFGSISVHSTLKQDSVSTQITLQDPQLSSALGLHVHEMEQKLHRDHGLRASVSVDAQAGSGSQADDPRQQPATYRASMSMRQVESHSVSSVSGDVDVGNNPSRVVRPRSWAGNQVDLRI